VWRSRSLHDGERRHEARVPITDQKKTLKVLAHSQGKGKPGGFMNDKTVSVSKNCRNTFFYAGGWFPISRQDIETILDHSGAGGAGTLLAVWLALLSVANSERSTSVVIHIGRVARLSGVSYRSAATALRRLASVSLVTIHTRKIDGTCAHDASCYELHATVSPCADFAEGTADFAEGTVNHDVGTLPTKNNNISLRLTPDNFQERAKAANGGRLTDDQLEAFCAYWTERNARGHCRFESEKFFELPRRIRTWASRERVASIPSEAPAAVKPERPIWKDCAARCRFWDAEKKWCKKHVQQEPKSCDHCREF